MSSMCSALEELCTEPLDGNHAGSSTSQAPRLLEKYKLTNLVQLNLSKQSLEELCLGVREISGLEVLDVSDNSLKCLPKIIGDMIRLKVLIASHNSITGTEEECLDFRRLKHLEVVDLSWNSLGGLPATLEDCPTLKHLDVSYNKLKFLPDSLQSSEVLETLILDGNSLDGLQRLPPWFNHLKRIEHMSLVGVWVFDLIGPLAKINFDQLTCLDLENSSLIEIPVALLGILTLETLRIGNKLMKYQEENQKIGRDFSENKQTNVISTLPEFGQLNVLTSSTLPEFGQLNVLTSFTADNLGLVALPSSISNLVNLETLSLAGNNLYKLPDLAGLKHLRILNVTKNMMCQISETLFVDLPLLVCVQLAKNILPTLPEPTGGSCLEIIDAYGNQMNDVPQGLACLPKLRMLDLGGQAHISRTTLQKLEDGFLSRYDELCSNFRRSQFCGAEASAREELRESGCSGNPCWCEEEQDGPEDEEEKHNFQEEEEDSHVEDENDSSYNSDDNWEPPWDPQPENVQRGIVGQTFANLFRSDDPTNPFGNCYSRTGRLPPLWGEEVEDNGEFFVESLFCPGDSHPVSQVELIARARREGKLVSVVYKDQFDSD